MKYAIILIGDGMGANHIQAANSYTGAVPAYQSWSDYWVSTYPYGGSYDPALYWSDFDYALSGATDSAAAATALFTGVKTSNGRISVNADGDQRLTTLAEVARTYDRSVGSVTSVYLSHATPGAWMSHNLSRSNGYAIADEGLWGDPNTTGTSDQEYYAGRQGTTYPVMDVLIGAGHPDWQGGNYINQQILSKIADDSTEQEDFKFVERVSGAADAGARLTASARISSTSRLVGLFGGASGNLDYRLADGSGANPENPTLAEMAEAALTVLNRNENGFILMIEGGAIDWASHSNDMDRMVGEQIAFDQTVAAVIDWVEDSTNGSSWENSIVLVTADHETGYLTAAPGEFANEPIGPVTPETIGLEKEQADIGRNASWEDTDGDSIIDPGEQVYWAWNTAGHSNSLVPFYVKGVGAEIFHDYIAGTDSGRGDFIDNTSVFAVIDELLTDLPEPTNTPPPTIAPSPTIEPTPNPFDFEHFVPIILR